MASQLHIFLGIIVLACIPQFVWSQNRVLSDCFSALQVRIPWQSEAESQGDNTMNNNSFVQYLAEDQFTFWYRFSAEQEGILSYAIWPTNTNDSFLAKVYRHNRDTTFCQHLVSGELQAEAVLENRIVGDLESMHLIAHSYELELEKGATYFVSVMSLKPDFCGHRMDLNFNGQRLHFNILNKPCFNFSTIEEIQEIELIETEVTTIEIDDIVPEITMPEADVSSSLDTSSNETPVSPASSVLITETEAKAENAQVDIYTTTDSEVRLADTKIEEGAKLNLEEIYFYNNTYAFRQESATQLEELLHLMKDYPELEIEIGGHTASNTSRIKPDPNLANRGEAWNFKGNSRKLSKLRAEAVKKYLIDRGVAAKRIETRGYADDEKIVENPTTPDDHRRNMRVEIAITSGLNPKQ